MNTVAHQLFWYFVKERQSIWYNRHILKMISPWTEDPVMKNAKITNMYRELDYGTQFVVGHILDQDLRVEERITKCLIYRLFNRVETYISIEPLVELYWTKEISTQRVTNEITEMFRDWHKAGNALYTGAYINTMKRFPGMSLAETAAKMTENMFYLGKELAFHPRLQQLRIHDVVEFLRKEPNIGPFISYQMAIDFGYPLINTGGTGLLRGVHHSDTCVPGPGCIEGLKILEVPKSNYHDSLKALHSSQIKMMMKFGVYEDMKFLTDHRGFRYGLTLANLEGCLCEFSRYWRALGGGHTKPWKPTHDGKHNAWGWYPHFDTLPIYGNWVDSDLQPTIY